LGDLSGYQPERMDVAEYARILSLQGAKIFLAGPTYWRQVRPFFCRPVLLYKALPLSPAVPPRSVVGGYQHVVGSAGEANSTIGFRVYLARPYSLSDQSREHRRMVRAAASRFEMRVIRDPEDLKVEGYGPYMSFYNRTQYDYLSDRTRPDRFARWADSFLPPSKAIILGAYADHRLRSVSILYWVENLLLYSTSFSDTCSLRQHVNDLMLHEVREIAAGQHGIKVIVAGTYSGGTGPDKFDLLRGAMVERQPARYVFRPRLLGRCVRSLLPRQFEKLRGGDVLAS
jgi:hypothetical protein